MCGIAGIAGHTAARFAPALEAMCGALRHRGPDAQGRQFFSRCALGHTRLSIVDHATGDQPFASNDGTLSVVFNGELYGYKELRARLPVTFRSASDTELIPALYALHGTQCVRHLPGMFAFALWDDHRQRLLGARDRFGEKPLYYAHGPDGTFVFASELKAILRSGLIRPVISRTALSAYLTLRYVPEGMTIYENVHSLPPGHALIHQPAGNGEPASNGTTRVLPYWQPPAPMAAPPSPLEAVEEFRRLMTQAVRRCLVADVEVGLLLSGGLDSTTIAALASREMPLRSFSFGFTGPRDERPYARAAAAAYGLEHTELTDATGKPDFSDMLNMLCRVYDEPFADSSALPTYQLCRRVSERVKVALSGDGGDELLAGYDYWYAHLVSPPAADAPCHGWSPAAERHWNDIAHFSPAEIEAMGLPPMVRPRLPFAANSVDDALRFDLATFLPADILKKTDRAAMAHGLELRAPFLDTDLAEFLIALPWQYKTDGTTHKLLLRQAFADAWPEAIRHRGKQGFGTSTGQWLAHPGMQLLREYYLKDRNRRIRTLLPDEQIDRHASGNGQKCWLLLVLAAWLEHAEWHAQ
ncbi:asparagine synthase (glutamine-hydrolyzing) [Desulfovibrio psychrotolerans]|uniref:asparagine synthase (glutamine-hydrolyzing) n=1 Tax=Desulfovibrio psychrotolerans TaxID=415242 RepID=A0A7J0BSK6_9BACT|nr:asparagine synthase (glutamine-hydrolyzing) [Desulfovibrio psychrotolerans]GFM36004.1 asparagine synthetase B [Desulfovibrio psychrotolerans]